MKSLALCVTAAIPAVGAVPAGAQDLSAGETIYENSCRNCHGPKAQGMASFPALAGRDEEYLVTRLTQYRAGETVGPNSALMQPNAADLTDDEIANVAAYIATTFE